LCRGISGNECGIEAEIEDNLKDVFLEVELGQLEKEILK